MNLVNQDIELAKAIWAIAEVGLVAAIGVWASISLVIGLSREFFARRIR